MENVIVFDHPLIQHKISLLRNKNTGSKEFRELVGEVSMLMCYEATRDLPLKEVEVETPIAMAKTKVIAGRKLAFVPIRRAGIGMLEGVLSMVPAAKVGHIGLYRDHETLEPVRYYCKLPSDINEREVIVLDPMLATGGSAVEAIKMLKEAGLDRINHNLNSSRSFYHNICSTHTFDQRVRNIHMLQGLGFEICSGGIIGMGESKEDVVDMLLELREIQPEALPINFLLPIKGTPLGNADISQLTTEYCMKVLCLARLLVPKADIRCAAGREVYFKGEEKKLLSVVDSIFASGYLTEGGQGIEDTLKTITDAGFTYEIESA